MTVFKIYSPVKVWIPDEDEEIVMSDNDAACCMDFILAAIKKSEDGDRDMLLRGLMGYYQYDDAINKKVLCAVPSVELDDQRRLVGVCRCCVTEELTKEEMESLKDYISGQYSDGWGEGFEQNCIATMCGGVYVSFWDRDPNWKMTLYDPAKEFKDALNKAISLLDELIEKNDEGR